jgi:hypothetical protein
MQSRPLPKRHDPPDLWTVPPEGMSEGQYRPLSILVNTSLLPFPDDAPVRACKPCGVCSGYGRFLGLRDEGELVARLVWRVKLVTEVQPGETTEVEVARLERDERAGLADLGLRLAETKHLMAAIQAGIVPAQVMVAGEHRRTCVACEGELASKGHCTATFRSLFGDVPLRIRRLLTCPCQNGGEAKSFAAFDLEPRPWRPNWPM